MKNKKLIEFYIFLLFAIILSWFLASRDIKRENEKYRSGYVAGVNDGWYEAWSSIDSLFSCHSYRLHEVISCDDTVFITIKIHKDYFGGNNNESYINYNCNSAIAKLPGNGER